MTTPVLFRTVLVVLLTALMLLQLACGAIAVPATASLPATPSEADVGEPHTPAAVETPVPSATTTVAEAAVELLPSPTEEPLASPSPTVAEPLRFDGDRALELAYAQCEIGPRPPGSEALLRTRDFIKEQLEPYGWTLIDQDFTYEGVPIHNLLAVKGEGAPLMVGAHFDTRPLADKEVEPELIEQPIIGGNDGASGVAVLLELGRVVEVPTGRQVQLAFFDAEDRGNIDGWPFSVGARYMAQNLVAPRPEALVVVDMIGDADQQIFREHNSDPELNDTIFGLADAMGYLASGPDQQGFFNSHKYTIIDDHLPFLEQGIPAIDLIDFDYPYWHTLDDTCDKLSSASLERVGRVVERWLEMSLEQSYVPVVRVR